MSLEKYLSGSEISRWCKVAENSADCLFKFCRKALQQQLPTNANLKRWGRSVSDQCLLCKNYQSNKHVLSHCPSPSALDRYTVRHNSVLAIFAEWLLCVVDPSFILCVDIKNNSIYKPISTVFNSFRPDIVLFTKKKVICLELTVCHESNFATARDRKTTKYANLAVDLKADFAHLQLKNTIYKFPH